MATSGNWLGRWLGQWFGAAGETPPGAMAGATSFSIAATGSITAAGQASARDYSGGADDASAFLIQQQSEANRIRKQNQAAIALILAAITEGILE